MKPPRKGQFPGKKLRELSLAAAVSVIEYATQLNQNQKSYKVDRWKHKCNICYMNIQYNDAIHTLNILGLIVILHMRLCYLLRCKRHEADEFKCELNCAMIEFNLN